MSEVVINADGKVLGRMAVQVAEQLKDGNQVHVINAEKAVVTGDRENVFQDYRDKRERGNREHGPYYPKAPDRIVKRTVNGMMPNNKNGQEAFKRLRTYVGNPDGRETGEDAFESKAVDDLKGRNYVSIQEISAHM
jgi:large subunit ribosomal protein L13